MQNLVKYYNRIYRRFFDKFSKKKSKYRPKREILVGHRTYIMLLMYDGFDYYGMQINKDSKTIERELMRVLFQSNLISEAARTSPQLCYFKRASRTDSQVSSIGQLCSAKFRLTESIDRLIDQMRSRLPPDIVLLDMFPSTPSFQTQKCDSRKYEYVIPTYALDCASLSALSIDKCHFRLSNDALVTLNHVLRLFVGSHLFHNYSSRKDPLEASARRYIIDINTSNPFLINDIEFVAVCIHGQSFMLHQIRKMIAMTIALMIGEINYSLWEKSFKLRKLRLPMAPGINLLLDEVVYKIYNSRLPSKDMSLKPILFKNYQDQRLPFKWNVIYRNIFKEEVENNTMGIWLQDLKYHKYFPYYEQLIFDYESELFHGIYQ